MKKLCFALVLVLFAFALGLAQDAKVSIDLDNVPVSEVLQAIEEQTPYRFSYRNVHIGDEEKVTMNCKDRNVKSVLDEILKPLGLDYKVHSKKNIAIFKGKAPKKEPLVLVGADVTDDFLESPLPDAKVEILTADSVKIQDLDVMRIMARDGNVAYAQVYTNLSAGQRYIMHGSLDGYEDAWVDIDIPSGEEEHVWKYLKLGKVFKKDLNEVVVTATKVKMFWKGDTIVYDASAFNLPDGSMLDDLIRQMPGVTMNDDGEIFVNGRKIDELLLGSRSFFRGRSEVLLKNLPFYTVNNVKVYEKSSDMSQALGYDVDPKQYVMDVNLQEKYERGVITNVEVAGGTADHYLGRAFVLGYTDLFRFSVVGNVNNVNETRHIGQSGGWTPERMPKSILTTRSVAGEVVFDNKKIQETLNIGYTSTTDRVEMHQHREYFLEGSNPLALLKSNRADRNYMVEVRNTLRVNKPWVYVPISYTHRKFSTRSFSTTEQSDNAVMTNSLTDYGIGSGHSWEFSLRPNGSLTLNKRRQSTLYYNFEVRRSVEDSDRKRRYDFILPQEAPLHNVNNYMNHTTYGSVGAGYSMLLFKGITLSLDEGAIMERTSRHDYLYHPDTLMLPSQCDALLAITDFANSYDSRYKRFQSETKVSFYKSKRVTPNELMRYPLDYRPFEATFIARAQDNSLRYHRGELIAYVTDNKVFFVEQLRLSHFFNNQYDRSLDFSVNHYLTTPSLYDLIDYRDDSQPLIVKLGNPNLKGNDVTEVKANFYSRGKFGRLFHVGMSLDYMHRSTAQSVMYAPETGVYTYCPVNVHGNYVVRVNLDFTKSFGTNRHWTISSNADASFNHNKDHTMLAGETQSRLNTVNTLMLHENAYVQFQKSALNIRATGDVRWRHSTGKMRDFSTLNAVDFQYGLSTRYTIPSVKMTISADGTMYSRRGYGSSSLNTNDFVLNASISQPFMKGRLVAKLEGFDLLHSLSQTQYEINAQGRVETWYRSLPHYAMLHLVYNFSIIPAVR